MIDPQSQKVLEVMDLLPQVQKVQYRWMVRPRKVVTDLVTRYKLEGFSAYTLGHQGHCFRQRQSLFLQISQVRFG